MLLIYEFKKLYPQCKDPKEWVLIMNDLFPKFEIDTAKRISLFIAQCGHESGGWKIFEENLNYSADGLNKVFPKYFKNAGIDAIQYHRNPEKIANYVYANRMGNGDVKSGDGWYFRGRGPIQLTGHDNYSNFTDDTGLDVLYESSLLSENKEIALMSAIWYWNKYNLNDYADKNDIKGCTRKINGGYNGLEERIKHYNKVYNILTNESLPEPEPIDFTLFGFVKYGSKGKGVKMIQQKLNLEDDGIFGKETEISVKAWQKNHNLVPDGIVGPKTLEKMLN